MMKSYIVDGLLLLITEKEDIIFYFYDSIMREYLEKVRTQNPDLKSYLTNMFRHYLLYKKQMLIIYNAGLSLILLKVLEKYFHAQIDTSKPIEEQYKVSFYIGGIFNHFQTWFSRGIQEPPEEIAQYALFSLPP